MHLIFLAMLIVALFFGGAWCSFICPYGALQDLLPFDKYKDRKYKSIKLITGGIFILLIMPPILLYGFDKIIIPYHMEDTFVTMDSVHGLILYYIITFSIIIISLFWGKRMWCKYICPMHIFNYIGIKISKILRIPQFRISGHKGKCVQCKKCNTVCPMHLNVENMVRTEKWDLNNCIQCGECMNICKVRALNKKWEKQL